MAFGMRAWLALTAVLLLLVAGWGFNPPPPGPQRRSLLPERQRFLELEKDLEMENWLYQRIFRRDSLVSELVENTGPEKTLFLGIPEATPDSAKALLYEAVRLQLADLGVEQPVVPTGIFLLPSSEGIHPGFSHYSGGLQLRTEYYVSRPGEAPFCIQAVPFSDRSRMRRTVIPVGATPKMRTAQLIQALYKSYSFAQIPSNPRAHLNTFGLCRYYARHGQPGPEIMEWLKAGASSLAEDVLPVDHQRDYGQGPIRGPFGKRRGSFLRATPSTLKCLDGASEECLALITRFYPRLVYSGAIRWNLGDLLADSPVDFIKNLSVFEGGLMGLDRIFFVTLEEEFGPERFGTFWRSELEPTAAFEEAFAQPLDLWVMEWLRRYRDPSRRGPGVPVQSTLFSLLALGLLAGGAVRMGRR